MNPSKNQQASLKPTSTFKTRYLQGENYLVPPNDPVVETRNEDTGKFLRVAREWARRVGVRLKYETVILQVWSDGCFMGWELSTFNYLPAAYETR